MLECSPGDTLIFHMMNTSSRNRMLFLGKVPTLGTARKTRPESESNQGDRESDDPL